MNLGRVLGLATTAFVFAMATGAPSAWASGGAAQQKASLTKALSALDEAVKATTTSSVTEADFEAAAAAVKTVDAAFASGKGLAESDEGYRRYAGDARAQFAITKARLRKSKKMFGVRVATREVTVAQRALDAALTAAKADAAKPADLEAAVVAADALQKAADGQTAQEKKDAGYAKLAAGARKAVVDAKAAVTQRRLQLAVAAHRAKVEGAKADVDGRVDGLSKTSKPDAFAAAEGAMKRLDEVIAEGKDLAGKDRKHAGWLLGLSKGQPDRHAKIKQRRLEAAEAALQAATEDLKEKSEADLEAAAQLVTRIEKLVAEDGAFAKSHVGHRRYLAQVSGRTNKTKSALDRRRFELGVSGHEAKLEVAREKVEGALVKLDGEPSPQDLSAAEAAVKGLEEVIEGGAALGRADAKYRAKLAGESKKAAGHRATIVRRRIEVLAAGLDAQFEGLSPEPTVDELAPLNAVMKSVQDALTEGEKLARSDRALGASIRKVQSGLQKRQRELAAKTLAAEIRPHRAKVEAAKAKVDAALAALEGKTEHELYVAAEGAVAKLNKAVESGAELGARDRAYGTFLGRLEAAHADQRALIRRRRIEAHEAEAKAKVEALAGTPDAAAFGAADKAVARLVTVTDSNRKYEHRGFARFVAGVDGRVKGYQARIATRRKEVAVAASAASLDEELAKAKAAIDALEGTPGASAFEAADKAVADAEAKLESPDETAKTDRGYQGKLASAKRTLAGHRATIAKRRVEVEVAAQRATVEEKAAAADAAVSGLTDAAGASAFEAADAALSAYEQAIEAGAATAKKDRAHAGFLAGAKRAASAHRAQVALRRLEVARAAAQAAIGELTEAPQVTIIEAAEGAVTRLETQISETPDLRDRKLASTLAAARRDAKAHRAKVAAAATEAKVSPERDKLVAAEKAVTEAMAALAEAPKPADFAKAEDTVRIFADLAEKNAALAAESKAFKKRLAAAQAAVPGYRKRIAARRSEVVIAAFRATVEEAEAEATSKVEAAEAEPGPASFKLAEEAAEAWASALEAGAKLAGKDRAVAGFVREQTQKLARAKKRVGDRRAQMQLDAHRAQVEEADGKVQSNLQKLEGEAKHEDYQAAESAIADLSRVLDAGEELAARDRAYGRFLQGLRSKKPARRALIRQRRIEAAERAAVASLEALEGDADDAAFREAERLVSRLEKVTDANASFAKQHAPYGRFVAGVRKRVLEHRSKIDTERLAAATKAHRAKVEARITAVTEALTAVESEPGPKSFAAVERAVKALDDEVREEPPVEASSKAHKKWLAGVARSVRGHRNKIAAARVALEVAGHQARLEEADAKAAEAMEALEVEAPAAAAFDAATAALDGVEQVIDDGESVQAKDKAYAKTLGGARRSLASRRKKVASRRVSLARSQVQAMLTSLEESPSDADATAAIDAIDRLEQLTAPSRKTKGQRATVKAVQLKLLTAPHQEKVEAAEAEARTKLEAVAGDEAKPADFEAATKAVSELSSLIDGGAELGTKSKAYKKYLAGKRKLVPGFDKTIARRRAARVQAAWTAKVEEAKAEVETQVEALEAEDVSAGSFEVAEQGVAELSAALDRSAPLAKKSRTVAKAVAAYRKDVAGFSRTIARRRASVRIAAHRAQVEEAKALVQTRLEALTEAAKHEDYQAAEEAIYALKKVVEEGDELGAADPEYGEALTKLSSQNVTLRATVRRRRVLAAQAQAEAKIEGLDAEASGDAYAEAYQAVARYESTVNSNASFGNQDAGYAKFTKAALRKVPGLRASVDRRRVDVAKAKLDERLAALDGSADAAAFSEAESALRDYAQVLEGTKGLSKQKKALPGLRAQIEARRVSVAREAAVAQVEALEEADGEGAFDRADEALDRLERTLGEAAQAGRTNKSLAKAVAKERKRATSLRVKVAKARSEFVVRPHREAVQAALSSAKEKVGGLDESSDAETFSAAEAAVEALEVEIGKGESLRRKSKSHAKFMDSASASARRLGKSLRGQRLAVRARAFFAELEVAQSLVEEAFGAAEEADEPDYDAVSKAVDAYQEKVAEGAAFSAANKEHRKQLAAARKRGPRWRARIVGVQLSRAEASVREQVESVESSPSPDGFVAAHSAVEAFSRAISEAKASGKAGKKRLGKAKKARTGYRSRIEAARVDAARKVVVAQMESLDGTDPESVEAAEEALENLAKAIAVAKAKAKGSKSVKKAVRLAGKSMKKDRARVKKAKRSAELAPVRSGLAEAASEASARMRALGDAPEADAVAAATEAVEALGKAIDEAAPLRKKSKTLAKSIKKQRKLQSKYARALAKARVHEQVSAHKARVREGKAQIEEMIAGLDAEAAHEDYQAAMSAVSSFGKIVAEGEELAAVDRKYGKYLAKVERRRASYPRRIRQRRIAAALEAADSKVSELGRAPDETAVSEAHEALDRVQTVMDSNANNESGKAFRKFVASTKRELWALRVQVAGAVVSSAVAALEANAGPDEFSAVQEALRAQREVLADGKRLAKRNKKLKKAYKKAVKAAKRTRGLVQIRRVEAALEIAKARVQALREDTSSAAIYDAENAVEQLRDVVKASKKLAKKNRGLKKKVRIAKKKASSYAKMIKRVKRGGSLDKKRRRSKRRRSRRG